MSIFTFYEGDIYPENGSKPGRIYVAPLDNAANGETIVLTAATSSSGPGFRSNQVILTVRTQAGAQGNTATLNAIGVRWDNQSTGEFDSYTDGRRASYGYRAIVPSTATRVKLIPAATQTDATVESGKITYVNGVKKVTLTQVARGSATPEMALNSASNTLFEVKVSHGGHVNTYTVSVQRAVPGNDNNQEEPERLQEQTSREKYAALIAQMYEWRNNDPQWSSYKPHTDRWDRALLAFGEAVEDTSLTPMTAAEAQALADTDWGERWEPVAAAMWELENRAPTVSAAIADATIVNESGTKQVSLAGVFRDADGDSLTVAAGSSDDGVATVSVAADYSGLTVTAKNRGTATITVTADDGKGGTVQDAFTVTVKAAPVVAAAIADVSGLEVNGRQDVSLAGVFSDADGDSLTVTASSSDDTKATVSVAADHFKLTVVGVATGTATITVTARDADGNTVSDAFDVSMVQDPQQQQQTPQEKYAGLIAEIYEWRNDPQWSSYKSHTDRWDRVLLAFGETVADTSLTPMTADEAQKWADEGWEPWIRTVAALRELEAGGQQQQTPNRAPTVAAAIADSTIVNESGTQTVSLSGVFNDADGDSLTITAASSDDAKATVSVASDHSALTVAAKNRGTATITVTADDGRGGTVSDSFTVTVKAAPVVVSGIADLSLEAEANQEMSVSGVFSDRDGDALTLTAESSDDTLVAAFLFHSTLTIVAVAEGTATITVTAEDSDGNTVSDAFDVTVTALQPANQAPTVASAIADATIVNESGTQTVSLSGVFSDADGDSLTISAVSSDEATTTVTVASGYSALTVAAKARGTATITVTADDGRGGTVSDTFTVTVKAAPVVAQALADVYGLETDATQDVSLSGVFSDADGDDLTITAVSSDDARATVSVASDGSRLTLAGVAEGTATVTVTAWDSDGNTVSDTFEVSVVKAPEPEDDPPADGETSGGAPTVVSPLPDLSLEAAEYRELSLSGVFTGPDGNGLRFTVASSNYPVATGWEDGSTLTVVATGTGTATITVTAEDPDGNKVSDAFQVTVAPAGG